MPTIAVIPGDGVGPEVVDQALAVLTVLDLGLDLDVLDHVNADTYLAEGVALSDRDFQRIADSAGVILGAVGDPRVSADYARRVLLRLRSELDLYVNLRPVRLMHERLSPLRDETRRAIDCVVVRENTEGLYAGIGGNLRPATEDEVAIDLEISTHRGVSRIIDFAFSVASREVCLVDKSNAVRSGGELWQRYWKVAVARHPRIAVRHLYADAAVMKLVEDPASFDVIVANNSHGDIISDLTAQLAGGLGAAPSANINPGSGFGLYEPVHGTAPDIAGKGVANPFGAILATAMLLDQVGFAAEAQAVRRAVDTAVVAGRTTRDLGGSLGTKDAGAAVLAEL